MSKAILQYLEGLEGESEQRLLTKLRRFSAAWPLGPAEEHAAGLVAPTTSRAYSSEEAARHDAHAVAIEQLAGARDSYSDALADLQKSREQRGRRASPADGSPAARVLDEDPRVQKIVARLAELETLILQLLDEELSARQLAMGIPVSAPPPPAGRKSAGYPPARTAAASPPRRP